MLAMLNEWTKLGLIVRSAGGPQPTTHAMLPTPHLTEGLLRVYFSSCDDNMRGRIYSADLSRLDPTAVLDIHAKPILDLGGTGAFDADGVNPSQLVERDGALFLYYIGWKRYSTDVPYTLLAGLAISENKGKTFERVSNNPILVPIAGELNFRTAPHVFRTTGGWGMLYIGGERFFTSRTGKRLPTYSLCRTYSKDGIAWSNTTETLLSPDVSRHEIGFGRPYLWTDAQGAPSLLISVRTEAGYTLCEMTAPEWSIRPNYHEILPCSEGGWDSEMICFGAPCAVDGWDYLFYNGNEFGRTGFGVARRRSTTTTAEMSGTLREPH